MATSAQRTSESAPEPDLYRPDAEGLDTYVWSLLRRGEFVVLVQWLVAFVSRLWKIQSDLLERQRSHKRRNAPSERWSALQAVLPGIFAPPANDVCQPPAKKRNKRGANKPTPHGRASFPAQMPRVPHVIPVPDPQRSCPRCHVPLASMGFETSEKLEVVPQRYVVVQTRREKLSCPCCREHIVTAEKPDEVIDRGALGEQLLVQSAVDHYQDGTPFERIARNAQMQGAPLSANTLARGVGKLIDLFDPIVRHVFHRCVASDVVGADATSMPVLDHEVPAGIRRGYLWNLLGDNRWSYFGYASSGHDAHLEALLKGIELDVLLCDGSATLNVLEQQASVRAGCHAHARSKIVAAVRASDPRAVEGLRLYAELFVVEAQSKQAGESPQERFQRRQRESRPIMERLRRWLQSRSMDVEPRSPLGLAVGYMLRQWTRLIAFLDDGRIDLTNNAVERQLRTWVIDRKVWMFVGHDESARRAAAALTVMMTCRQHGIDPRAYMLDTLRKILAGTKDVAQLWPENYVATKPQASTGTE